MASGVAHPVPGYTISSVLGQGAAGSVFKATRTRDGAIVALKQVDLFSATPAVAAKILSEVAILSKLNHSHCLRFIESYSDKRMLTIVTEYCEGGNLLDYLRAHGKLKYDVVLSLARTLLGVLSYLHRMGVAHRDIKVR
jgi:serine/threonine protein kinase